MRRHKANYGHELLLKIFGQFFYGFHTTCLRYFRWNSNRLLRSSASFFDICTRSTTSVRDSFDIVRDYYVFIWVYKIFVRSMSSLYDILRYTTTLVWNKYDIVRPSCDCVRYNAISARVVQHVWNIRVRVTDQWSYLFCVRGRNKYHDAVKGSHIEFPTHTVSVPHEVFAYPAVAYSYHSPSRNMRRHVWYFPGRPRVHNSSSCKWWHTCSSVHTSLPVISYPAHFVPKSFHTQVFSHSIGHFVSYLL